MRETDRVDILNDNIAKSLLKLCIPIFICGFAQQLYNIIDLFVVSNYVDELSVAIIGGSSSLLSSIATNFLAGIVSGSIVIIGNKIGEGNNHDNNDCISSAYCLMGVSSVVFIVLYFIFGSWVLSYLKVPPSILYDSSIYLKMYSLGFFGYGIFQLSINILRTNGETKIPTILLICSFILNIVFDFIIIVGLKSGYIGVCISYTITQLISAAAGLYFVKKECNINYKLVMKKEFVGSILKVGVPSAVTSLAFSLTSTHVQSYFNLLDEKWISAYGIYAKYERLFWIIMNGLQFSFCTFVSQNNGAKNYKRLNDGIKIASVIFIVSALICSLVVEMGSLFLIKTFIRDVDTISYCRKITNVVAPFYIIYSIMEIFTGYFKGIKKANIPLIINLLCICAVRIVWLELFAANETNYLNVCACWPISWVLSAIVYYVVYKSKKKELFI